MAVAKKILRLGAMAVAPLLYANFFRKTKSPLGKPIVCLSFDCDLPEDYERLPALLDQLGSFEFKGSFGIIGKWLEKFPRVHARILDEGHEIFNHTYSHPNNEIWNEKRFFNQLLNQFPTLLPDLEATGIVGAGNF